MKQLRTSAASNPDPALCHSPSHFFPVIFEPKKANEHHLHPEELNKKQKALLIACAILILAMGLLSRGLKPPPAAEKDQTPPAKPISAVPKSAVNSALPRRTAKIEPVKPPGDDDFDPYAEWSLKRILNTFMVPPGQIEATDSDELIARLDAIYLEYGGPGLDLAFQPAVDFDPPIRIDHDNISFDSLLKLIGIVAGHELHIGDSKVTLTPLETNPSTEIVSSQKDVPPNLLERRPHIEDDPFSDPPAFDPKRAFEHFGIVLGEDVGIQVDRDNSTWAISGTPAEVDRIERLVELAFGEVPAAIAIEHKLFELGEGAEFPLESQTFATQAEASAFIQELVSSPDVTTVSYPRVMTRAGQSATIESSVTVPVPTALDAEGNPSEVETRVLGMQLPMTPSLAGLDRIHIDGAHETSQLRPGVTGEDGQITQVLSESDFVNTATDIQGQLFQENTALIPFQQPDGTTTYQLLTVQRLDPAGQPISP